MSRAIPGAEWFQLGLDSWMLGLEASDVIGLRMSKLAMGDAAAAAEAERTVREKMTAAMLLGHRAVLGELGSSMPGIAAKTVKDLRGRVRANRTRL